MGGGSDFEGACDLVDFVAFSWGEEEVLFEAVLSGVGVEVASVEGEEVLVGAAFDDVSGFDDEDLVGAADGGETSIGKGRSRFPSGMTTRKAEVSQKAELLPSRLGQRFLEVSGGHGRSRCSDAPEGAVGSRSPGDRMGEGYG